MKREKEIKKIEKMMAELIKEDSEVTERMIEENIWKVNKELAEHGEQEIVMGEIWDDDDEEIVGYWLEDQVYYFA